MNRDIKQARQLLQNLIQTNPKHAPGWIAAASLEGELSFFPKTKLTFSSRQKDGSSEKDHCRGM
jgi:hypothetical protein